MSLKMTISRPSTSPLWKLLSVTCVAVLSMTILTTSSAAGGTDSTHPIYGGRHGDHLTTLCRGATIKSIEIAYNHEIRALRVGCAKTVGGEVNWQGWIGDKSTHRTWVMTCPNVRYGSKMYLGGVSAIFGSAGERLDALGATCASSATRPSDQGAVGGSGGDFFYANCEDERAFAIQSNYSNSGINSIHISCSRWDDIESDSKDIDLDIDI